jgi:hypothetical protein
VSLSARLALESALITTDVVMVPLFPYLAIRYGVTDVPTTVVDGIARVVGPRPEDEFVDAIVSAAR